MSAPVVTVRGEGRREGPPELATLSVTVHSSFSSANDVRVALAAASRNVGDILRRFEASLERFATTGLHVAPMFNRRNPTKISGYRGSFSTEVVVSDFDVLPDLVMALSALAEAQVDGPWWSLRPDSELYRSARLAAIEDAKRRADDYAAAFGAAVDELVEVSDLGEMGVGPMPRTLRAAAAVGAEAESAFEFEPARHSVTGQVTVRFTLKGGAAQTTDASEV